MNQQPLPPGWTEHESSSHPGHKYYFNSVTGCKTWNREDLIGWTNSNGNVSSQAKVDDNNIDDQVEIRQLEMLLANKKKEQETVSWNSKCIQRTTHSLRSDLQSGTLENSKDEGSSRQKIVFDLKNNERRRDVNENVVQHHSHVHEKSQNKDACVGKEGVENEVMESGNEILNNSSDSSLYGIDDDEIEELEKIKSKYASPPKSAPSDQTNTVLQDEEKSSAPSDKINPVLEVEEKLTATIECLGNQSSKYLPENYGFQYVNYQNEPKEKYQRVYKPRDRPVLKKLKGNFQDKPLASSTVKESIIASNLDRTPEQNLDTTPVYGSLDDSVDRELDVNYHGAGSNSSSTFEEKICDSSLSLDQSTVQELFQSVWEIIACFTRGFATALSIHNTMPKFEPDIQFQSESYASRNLPTFFTLVSSLQEAMLNVVSAGGSGHHLHTFHSLLTQFRTNLELDQSYWPPFDKVITPPQLEKFLTDEDNEHIVRGGLEQISEFRQLLIRCISRNEHQAL